MPADSTRAVFLSYASQDADAARRICETLRAAGIDVWFDQSELRGGDAWDAKIRKQIKECALFVPVISANSQARREGYFRLEWKLAVQRTHTMADGTPFLLPVLIDATRDDDALVPEEFRAVQWTSLNEPNSLNEFCRRLTTLLDGKANHSEWKPANAAPKPDGKSIAVLAFANLSHDPENEYFCDGVSDELLTVLQKIDGLRVAARPSAFFFKGRHATAQKIGEVLGVAHLVEGSVRKSGNLVRITARLSRALTGEQLWSESYTRELKDIFAVQDEIAGTIVRELRARLPGPQDDERGRTSAASDVKVASRGRTENAEAFRLYLQGRFFAARLTAVDSERGISYFQQALALDPGFALAWAELARAYSWQAGWIGTMPFDEGFRLSREAAERALALEPNLVEGLSALFRVQAWHDWQWVQADATIRRALALAPGDASVLADAASLAISVGDTERAIQLGRLSVEHDPVNAEARIKLGLACLWAGQLNSAEEAGRRASELNPTMTWGFGLLAMVYFVQGRFAEAIEVANKEQAEWLRLTLSAVSCFAAGRAAEADAALRRLLEHHADLAPYQIAQVFACRGEISEAFTWLHRACDQRDSGIAYTKLDPLLRNLHGSEQWPEFLGKIGLAPEQLR